MLIKISVRGLLCLGITLVWIPRAFADVSLDTVVSYPMSPVSPTTEQECADLREAYANLAQPFLDKSEVLGAEAQKLDQCGSITCAGVADRMRMALAYQRAGFHIKDDGSNAYYKCQEMLSAYQKQQKRDRDLESAAKRNQEASDEDRAPGALDKVKNKLSNKMDSMMKDAGIDPSGETEFTSAQLQRRANIISMATSAGLGQGLSANPVANVVSRFSEAGIQATLETSMNALDRAFDQVKDDSSDSASRVDSDSRFAASPIRTGPKASLPTDDAADLNDEIQKLTKATNGTFQKLDGQVTAVKSTAEAIREANRAVAEARESVGAVGITMPGMPVQSGNCEAEKQNIHSKYDGQLAALEQRANSVTVGNYNQWGCQLYTVYAQMRGEVLQYAQHCRPDQIAAAQSSYQQGLSQRNSACQRRN